MKTLVPFAAPRNPVDVTAQFFNDLSLIDKFTALMLDRGGRLLLGPADARRERFNFLIEKQAISELSDDERAELGQLGKSPESAG